MSKFTKATKRIAAVAASAVMVSSAAFGAGLSSYPTNFVKDGKFNGQIVVGSAVGAADSTSAVSIIEDLKSEFSGSEGKVQITYKKAGTGGEKVSIMKSNSEINFKENIKDSFQTSALDDSDLDLFLEREYNNEDYNQEYTVATVGGTLTQKLGSSLHDSQETDDQVTGIFFDKDASFGTYTLTFDNAVEKKDSEKISIMGNEYIISKLAATEVTLLGGSNVISLGEGDPATKVTYEGKTYEVSVQSVGETKVLVTVNGVTKSVEEGKSLSVGGVEIAVTDLVQSNRDAIKGYAELVVGGQEIKLKQGLEVEVDGERLSLSDDRFTVKATTVTANSTTLTKIVLDWTAKDNLVLEKGESFEDPLFGTIRWSFDKLVEGTTKKIEFTTGSVTSSISGVDRDGKSFNLADVVEFEDATGSNEGKVLPVDTGMFLGGDNDVYMYLYNTNSSLYPKFNQTNEGMRFIVDADDETTMYELMDYDLGTNETMYSGDDEVTIRNVVTGSEFTVDFDDINDKLEKNNLVNTVTGVLNLTLVTNVLNLDNGAYLNFSSVGTTSATFTLSLDADEVDADDETSLAANELVTIVASYDTTDDEVQYAFTKSTNMVGSAVARSDDEEAYVSTYGIKATLDSKAKDKITLEIPDKQAYAEVSLTFGGAATSTMTKEVKESALEAEKAELEDEGYTVVSTEKISATAVTFDVKAPVLDTAVTGSSNMIVVGGPAVNKVAAELLGMSFPTYGVASGVEMDEAVIRYFADKNSVVVYGYEAKDTQAAVAKLNARTGLSGELVEVQN